MRDFHEAAQFQTSERTEAQQVDAANVLAVLGLNEAPFAEEAHDLFFFPSHQHLRALGFIGQLVWSRANLGVILGERGVGKSFMVRHLLADLDDRVLVANVCTDKIEQSTDPQQFLLAVLRQYGMQLDATDRGDRRRLLTRFLTHQYSLNRLCILIIQDVQALRPAVLDELLHIAELTVEGQRVVKLLLLGGHSLQHVIDSPRMANLTTGRAPRFTLENLSEDQVAAYVVHRLRVAGATNPDDLVDAMLMPMIHRYSWGVPRTINKLCETAMIQAVADGAVRIDANAITHAAVNLGLIPSADEMAESLQMAPLTSEVLPLPEAPTDSAPVEHQALLVVSAQGATDSVVPLLNSRLLIGRGDLADVRVQSAFVSRYHALIVREIDRDLLIDLGSTNGVLVNSKRVVRKFLKHRDLIQVGPARLTYLNPALAPQAESDPSETLKFARPGIGVPEDETNGTAILAFGHFNEAS